VASDIGLVVLLFLIDFVTLSLSTDNAVGSAGPSRWGIAAVTKVAVAVGLAACGEALGLLAIAWGPLGYADDLNRLHTFTFGLLFFSCAANLFVVRERRAFWASAPSVALMVANLADAVVVVVICVTGFVPGLPAIPGKDVGIILAYSVATGLLVNDGVKLAALRRWAPRLT
jgi:H+-transporting ATPase